MNNNNQENNGYKILNIFNKVSINLNLDKKISNNTILYYKKIIENEEQIINHLSLIAICIFFAIKIDNPDSPIGVEEISKAFQLYGHNLDPRLILRDGIRYRKHLKEELSVLRNIGI